MSLSLSPDMKTFVSGACDASAKVIGMINLSDYDLYCFFLSFFLSFISFGIYEKACVNKHFPAMNRISMLLPYVNRSFDLYVFLILIMLNTILFFSFIHNSSFQMDRHLLQDLMMQLVVYSIFVLIKK
jgi:hypothetical protein